MKKKTIILTAVLAMLLLCGCMKSAQVQEAEAAIEALPEVTEIASSDEDVITAARALCDALSEKDQTKIENIEKLNTAEKVLADIKKAEEEAAEKARLEAEEKARKESEEKARLEAEAKIPPAPVEIHNIRIGKNSIGTPELYVQFKNTSDKKIEALSFYGICFDAYGDLMYSGIDCSYEEGILPGKSSDSSWHWTLYGFNDARSFKLAVYKYKLAGETTVEIPESRLVWIE